MAGYRLLQRVGGPFLNDISQGYVPGHFPVNKYGRSTNVDTDAVTDIWNRADSTDDQKIWIAPTQARKHNIKSTSVSDDGDPVGVGARTIRIFGLTSWTSLEVSEDITMNGTADVQTANAYVIIFRMYVLTKGATSINVGKITATAQGDGTVSAQIQLGIGRTTMAIYGIPSTQILYLTGIYASIHRAGSLSTGAADISLCVNPDPETDLLNFRTEDVFGLQVAGTSTWEKYYPVYKEILGPALIKLQGISTVNNLDVSSGFDGVAVVIA